MTLEEIHALHPKGADAATLRSAITHAEELRASLLQQTSELEQTRQAGLLTLEAHAILQAEQKAAEARLDADRIEALIPAMEQDWRTVAANETLADLRQAVGPVIAATAALEAWKKDLATIRKLIGKGLKLHDAAQAARQSYLRQVDDAYRRPEVMAAGSLDVTLPPMPADLPRKIFPTWELTEEDL